MLAARLSLMNHFAELASATGADPASVQRVLGADPRIGPSFLTPGLGFGGSCLPKDSRALAALSRSLGVDASLLDAVLSVNQRRPAWFASLSGPLEGKTAAVWGLSFKPHTDDCRDSPALALVSELLERGAQVRVFDPVARPPLDPRVHRAVSALDAATGADVLFLATEWPEFLSADFASVRRSMRGAAVVDCRSVLEVGALRDAGFSALPDPLPLGGRGK
jgi:UDPglucose 6-dehydrogenase